MKERNNKREFQPGRRNFIKWALLSLPSSLLVPGLLSAEERQKIEGLIYGKSYSPREHRWGMGIKVDKCIGCGRCVNACKLENNVPEEPFFFRTWVEQFAISSGGEVIVQSPNGGRYGFVNQSQEKNIIRSFYVPKLCNQCDKPPCVQVCPVGATFKTDDGVILVDAKYCIGCRYCIQACPYGARFLHPATRVAEKCTFCYHRIVKGLLPACVEACPTQARVFGDLEGKASPLVRFTHMNKILVLKQYLNTEPKVFYANLDMEVK
ncbi:MAG TPA: 4Fe-4S dicluster domain-containing protein [Thermodesulfobacteriota bacterium]|nr:4Fe-4S dicluster domain-containing protein [Thermodesulfobacteriota bacterium]